MIICGQRMNNESSSMVQRPSFADRETYRVGESDRKLKRQTEKGKSGEKRMVDRLIESD